MLYRIYAPADFAPLYAIEERCFAPPLRFGRRYMRQRVECPDGVTWIAEDDGRMAGFAIADWTGMRGQNLAYIETLEVLPEFRRQGVGMELLRKLENSARTAGARVMWLHVDADNAAAIHLYESHGYAYLNSQQDYYGPGRAAAVYTKPLD